MTTPKVIPKVMFKALPQLSCLLITVLLTVTAACSDPERESQAVSPVTVTAGPSGSSCSEVALSRRNLRFCYRDTTGQAATSREEVNVVYFFHGLNGDVTDLFSERGRQILDGISRLLGSDTPVIASLSVGSTGVIGNDAAEIVSAGLPAVEGSMAPGKTIHRLLVGASMGGHNVLRLAAEAPNQFAGVAALCPALGTVNGHDDQGVASYIQRNRAVLNEPFFRNSLAIYKAELPTAEIWEANNPFTFLNNGAYDMIPVFLSVGRQDSLGFFEGAREFKRRADLRGARVEYREVTGIHCVFDVQGLLEFVTRNAPAGS